MMSYVVFLFIMVFHVVKYRVWELSSALLMIASGSRTAILILIVFYASLASKIIVTRLLKLQVSVEVLKYFLIAFWRFQCCFCLTQIWVAGVN